MDIDRIVEVVTSVYGIDRDGLKGKCRQRRYVYARISIIVLLRGIGLSLRKTGLVIGRDHATVSMHELYTSNILMKQDAYYKENFKNIKRLLETR